MNKTISFCAKNQQGLVSLIRILTIKPDGACYIRYQNNNSNYHVSLHPPDINHVNGQMHIKANRKIIYKRKIAEFHNFNMNRCFESVIILESELRNPTENLSESVNVLHLPENHLAHIMFVRSDKAYGHIEAAFMSNKPNSQPNENIIPYPVFCEVEDMPIANYYLTCNIQPIDKSVLDYVADIKRQYIKSGMLKKENNHIFHVRHPFLSTDIEICITSEDLAKYEEQNKNA